MVNPATPQVEASQPAAAPTAGLTPEAVEYFSVMLEALENLPPSGDFTHPDYLRARRQQQGRELPPGPGLR